MVSSLATDTRALKRMNALFAVGVVFVATFVGLVFPSVVFAQTCGQWVAKVVSVQGSVQSRSARGPRWVSVAQNDTFCPGDMLRVQERSRAAIVLSNGAILRLDENSTLTLGGLEREESLLMNLLTGAAYFFSRIPRSLKVATPFVNGSVEGTEFYMQVADEETLVSVFQGRVLASNKAGSLMVQSGESAVAYRGQAPISRVVVRPRQAVQWALYYPSILHFSPEDFLGEDLLDWQRDVRRSMAFCQEGDLAKAFSCLERASDNIRDARFFTYRAELLLKVGRIDEARSNLERAIQLDPASSDAFSLQSIIAVVQNQEEEALELAKKAATLDGESSPARVALSYAKQALFDLPGALEAIEEAVNLSPGNAIVWARLAELRLSVGHLDKAEDAAKEAVFWNPNLALTETVLGYANLTKIKTDLAKKAFQKAIALDQTAPLPRLGLGLAKIREGELNHGRGEIEIAVSLDPNNALIRSYLGKAYFDEKLDKLALGQFAIAKALDPKDPTPWFYDAIRKQTQNRPVEAVHDLQKSVELNNNRAVYRSRLLLDEDLAARSASIGRIYRDLGFRQLALVEGWKSVNTDPANYSAHRFLADTYDELPRHEIAKVSELLQSQLLQPINITPVQPQLAEGNLFIPEGAGPAEPSFNEFNPLFLRNRLALQASGIWGENDTFGDELVHSALWGRFCYSLGHFHYETDGFRDNNDQKQDIYDVFTQVSLSPATSVQAEFRYKDVDKGDLLLRFDPHAFLATLRQEEDFHTARLGIHHAFAPHSDVVGSVIYRQGDYGSTLWDPIYFDIDTDEDGYLAEGQYLFRSDRFDLITGGGRFDADREEVMTQTIPIPPVPITSTSEKDTDIRHSNLYVYSLLNYPDSCTWTVGGSAEFFDSDMADIEQLNPKVGLLWHPTHGTTVRAAAFRTLKRMLISSQTIEPTQVAGFNQFFDDVEATEAWRYGAGIDQKVSSTCYLGAEFSKRDLDVPLLDLVSMKVREVDWEEYIGRGYLFWTPLKCLALATEYQFEKWDRDPDRPGEEAVVELTTHRFSLGARLFHPEGLIARWKATYVRQDGDFGNALTGIESDDDQFWTFDASVGYRLPKRLGLVEVEIKNIFDEDFHFQDTDPKNSRVFPERLVLGRITFSF